MSIVTPVVLNEQPNKQPSDEMIKVRRPNEIFPDPTEERPTINKHMITASAVKVCAVALIGEDGTILVKNPLGCDSIWIHRGYTLNVGEWKFKWAD